MCACIKVNSTLLPIPVVDKQGLGICIHNNQACPICEEFFKLEQCARRNNGAKRALEQAKANICIRPATTIQQRDSSACTEIAKWLNHECAPSDRQLI